MREHIEAKHPKAEITDEIERSFAFGSRNERIFLKLEKGKPEEREKDPAKKRSAKSLGVGSSKKARFT